MLSTFNPGPSKVYTDVRQYMTDAYDHGILSMGHRGERFVTMSKAVVAALKVKLNIPQEYFVYFTSSATECWEIIAQSLTKEKSLHFYNGAFGERWYQYAKALKPASAAHQFGVNEVLTETELPAAPNAEMVCITQNETSNGTQIDPQTLLRVSNRYKEALLAVDATSSLGGLNLKYIRADIWFASVQKCLGLPAGLGILVCSPRAIERARKIGEKAHYNSLISIHEKMLNFQTTHTPNVLGIYLLGRVLEKRPQIKTVQDHLRERATVLYRFIGEECPPTWQPLVTNPATRSTTVVAVQVPSSQLDEIKRQALQQGVQLGNGYGAWAKNTFRIANFPQIQDAEYDILQRVLAGIRVE